MASRSPAGGRTGRIVNGVFVQAVAPHSRTAEEIAWLESVLAGGPPELPPRLVPDPELRDLAQRLAEARDAAKQARVLLLKREAAVQAEARQAPIALAGVEPDLAHRVAHRVGVTLRRARAAKRALGPKPVLDRETEQRARRAMSRLEDALFAHSRARGRVHSRLAVGNVVGLLLALAGAVVVWNGADLDASSVYAVFALSGLAPLTALAIGGVGALHARHRVHSTAVACAEAFGEAGVNDAEELAQRRAELEDWLARADATAEARDAWHEALDAWQTMAGPEADPKDVEDLLAAGGRLHEARAAAAAARLSAEEAGRALLAVEAEVQRRLESRPRVGDLAIDVREREPAVGEVAYEERFEEPEADPIPVETVEVPVARTFVFDADAARRLRRRTRRLR